MGSQLSAKRSRKPPEPLLSAEPAVTLSAAVHHRPLAGTKLYCLMTGEHGREQHARSCYH